MSVNFVCQSCKKKIKAPDESGGKWGKCPYCKIKCYVPRPLDPGEEELKLAPVDEEYVKNYGSMMRETYTLTHEILHETAVDDESAGQKVFTDVDEHNLEKYIIIYLRSMADGQLDDAQGLENSIVKFSKPARAILRKIVRAETPEPELADVAPKVLQAMAKALIVKLK